MKITDYAPRAAPFDSYLTGRDLVGVEVGVDVGAHAEAMLTYCPVAYLTLVDIWPNPWCRGYCEGRLSRFRGRFTAKQNPSVVIAEAYADDVRCGSLCLLDFVYIDQEHGAESVAADLRAWWPLLKPRGVLGYRNYTGNGTPLDGAIDAFVGALPAGEATRHVEDGEIVLVKA